MTHHDDVGHDPFDIAQGMALQCSRPHGTRGGSSAAGPDPIMCGEWKNASEATVWCEIYWGNKGYAVASKDANNNVTFDYGGFQMAYGPASTCNSFYVEGLLEALDSEEEFYHDVGASKLYFIPNASHPTPLPETVVAVVEQSILKISGTQAEPVTDVTLRGIIFTGAAKTFLAPHEATTDCADWAASRRGAVVLEGVVGVVIDNCSFDTLGGNAVLFSNYVRNSSVVNSTFAWIGESGVLSMGTDDFGNATDGEHPLNNAVKDSFFREVGV